MVSEIETEKQAEDLIRLRALSIAENINSYFK